MRVARRRKSIGFFIAFGVVLVVIAVGLNVGWILLTPRQLLLIVVGVFLFGLIIAGLILNTIFLVREIRRNEEHDSFINAVTHELKTPIASMRLYLETLQTRDLPEAKRQEFYQIMLADSDRLLHTVEQVLRAGRSGHRRRKITLTSVNIEKLLHACIAQTRARFPHLAPDAIRFEANTDEAVYVRGDADELHAVFANLIDNAVKYSPERVAIDVRLRVVPATVAARNITIEVEDRGLGIAPNELKPIFKRFYRAPISTRVKGTGLGLFIVQAIIRKHRGRVYAMSDGINRGSTFTVELPRAANDMPTLAESDDHVAPVNVEASLISHAEVRELTGDGRRQI